MTSTAKKLGVADLDERSAARAEPHAHARAEESIVGLCVADTHPVPVGRFRVRWDHAATGTQEVWLPTLRGLVVHEHDRMLLLRAAHIELPGKLTIRAVEIEMSAERGKVRIEAHDDVEIRGEMVRLN